MAARWRPMTVCMWAPSPRPCWPPACCGSSARGSWRSIRRWVSCCRRSPSTTPGRAARRCACATCWTTPPASTMPACRRCSRSHLQPTRHWRRSSATGPWSCGAGRARGTRTPTPATSSSGWWSRQSPASVMRLGSVPSCCNRSACTTAASSSRPRRGRLPTRAWPWATWSRAAPSPPCRARCGLPASSPPPRPTWPGWPAS
jgi:hypothetical protein